MTEEAQDPYIGIDGFYRFVCENGHHVVTSEREPTTCTAPVHSDGSLGLHVTASECAACYPCGAEFEYREVDYFGPSANGGPT